MAHLHGPVVYFPEVPAASLVELVAAQFLDYLAEAVDIYYRFAQVVGNRVIECLQLPVGGFQFRGPSRQVGVQHFDFLLRPLALGDVLLYGDKIGDDAVRIHDRGNGDGLNVMVTVLFTVDELSPPNLAGSYGLPELFVYLRRSLVGF